MTPAVSAPITQPDRNSVPVFSEIDRRARSSVRPRSYASVISMTWPSMSSTSDWMSSEATRGETDSAAWPARASSRSPTITAMLVP